MMIAAVIYSICACRTLAFRKRTVASRVIAEAEEATAELPFPAPPLWDPFWGEPGNDWTPAWEINDPETAIGSNAAVVSFGGAFLGTNTTLPSREEILASFTKSRELAHNELNNSRSGATFIVSDDKRFLAKSISGLNVKYMHKLAKALREVNQPTLLNPVLYLFQRCKGEKFFFGNAMSKILEAPRGTWRTCDAWMVVPLVKQPEAHKAESFDVKASTSSLYKANDHLFKAAYPQGLGLSQMDMKKLHSLVQNTVRVLQMIEAVDYSLLIKINPASSGCESVLGSQVYRATSAASENGVFDKCLTLGAIDYFGNKWQGYMRGLGLSSSYSADYAREWSTTIAQLPSSCGPPYSYFHTDCRKPESH